MLYKNNRSDAFIAEGHPRYSYYTYKYKLPTQYIARQTIPDKIAVVQIETIGEFTYEETDSLHMEAWLHFDNNDFNEAIRLFSEAIQLEPQQPELYFDLSNCYLKKTQYDLAIETLNKAINIDNTKFEYYNNRGLLYYKLRNKQSALNDINQAIILNPENPNPYANMALIYYYIEQNIDSTRFTIQKAESLGLDLSQLPQDLIEAIN